MSRADPAPTRDTPRSDDLPTATDNADRINHGRTPQRRDAIGTVIRDVIRHVTIVLPNDLPNSTYTNLIRGLQELLRATELGPHATIHPDPHITDEELNASHDKACARSVDGRI